MKTLTNQPTILTVTTTPVRRPHRPGTDRATMITRRHWAHLIATTHVECRRCHQRIHPGDKWELGHPIDAPYAAGNYNSNLRPEHAHCNKTGLVIDAPPTFDW